MKILIITFEKKNDSLIESQLNHYKKQIKDISIKNIKPPLNEEKEILLVEKHIENGDVIICLDENGKEYTSNDFSSFLTSLNLNYRRIVFIIGKAEGLSKELKKRANYLLSLSQMTYPHHLAKLFLVEQIYRAQTIINNHPYHK